MVWSVQVAAKWLKGQVSVDDLNDRTSEAVSRGWFG